MASTWIKDLNLNSYISLSATPCQSRCSIASLQKEFQVWKAAALPVSCFAKIHPGNANTLHFTLAKGTTIFLLIPFVSFHIWQKKYQCVYHSSMLLELSKHYCFLKTKMVVVLAYQGKQTTHSSPIWKIFSRWYCFTDIILINTSYL